MSFTVAELAHKLDLPCHGAVETVIQSVASSSFADEGQLTFVIADKKHRPAQLVTNSIVITTQDISSKIQAPAFIISATPQLSFAHAIPLVLSLTAPLPQVHSSAIIPTSATIYPTATIMENVVIGQNVVIRNGVIIGANSTIGSDCVIGNETQLDSNVTIYSNTQIGEDCRIASGATIGSPGFGIIPNNGSWERFPQIGGVKIGDKVDIGANCCIDRGAIEDTIIESGVKLDNLIQVAHNVQIGENTVIAACTGIAGSTKIGKHCQIGGRASIQGHIEITDGVVITTCTFVNKSIVKPGVYSSSLAMQKNTQWHKNHARLHRLDKMARQVNRLELKLCNERKLGEGSDK